MGKSADLKRPKTEELHEDLEMVMQWLCNAMEYNATNAKIYMIASTDTVPTLRLKYRGRQVDQDTPT